MRDTIRYQLGLLDVEYAGKDMPMFTVNEEGKYDRKKMLRVR